jgi:two-component system response regulator AtoC
MVEVIARAARRGRVAGEDVGSAEPDFGLLGSSKPMQQVRELISKLAVSSATVLVRGETGTGKELVAKAIHDQSRASAGPFVPLHAAALPHELLESELFGYERGAFTGATTAKPGRVELAASGSLFLDEIAEISASVQTKLLRLLQEREFSRLGATRTLKTDTRFITATHRNLELMAERGEFRQDLLYRLNVLTVWLPPLRARREDIGELAEHFLERFASQRGEPKLSLEPAALTALCANRWPGNVRELANVLERLSVLTSGGVIREADVKAELEGRGAFTTQPSKAGVEPRADFMTTHAPASSVRPLKDHLQKAERAALLRALERAKGNRTIAARLLGVGRRTLYTKLEEHDLL